MFPQDNSKEKYIAKCDAKTEQTLIGELDKFFTIDWKSKATI